MSHRMTVTVQVQTSNGSYKPVELSIQEHTSMAGGMEPGRFPVDGATQVATLSELLSAAVDKIQGSFSAAVLPGGDD